MALRTEISARVHGVLTGTADHGTPGATLDLAVAVTLLTGTGANLADRMFSDQRTLATTDKTEPHGLADII